MGWYQNAPASTSGNSRQISLRAGTSACVIVGSAIASAPARLPVNRVAASRSLRSGRQACRRASPGSAAREPPSRSKAARPATPCAPGASGARAKINLQTPRVGSRSTECRANSFIPGAGTRVDGRGAGVTPARARRSARRPCSRWPATAARPAQIQPERTDAIHAAAPNAPAKPPRHPMSGDGTRATRPHHTGTPARSGWHPPRSRSLAADAQISRFHTPDPPAADSRRCTGSARTADPLDVAEREQGLPFSPPSSRPRE